jgi:hypothetical protein
MRRTNSRGYAVKPVRLIKKQAQSCSVQAKQILSNQRLSKRSYPSMKKLITCHATCVAIGTCKMWVHDRKVDEACVEKHHDAIGDDESICETCVA